MEIKEIKFVKKCCENNFYLTEDNIIFGILNTSIDDIEVIYYRCPICYKIYAMGNTLVEYNNHLEKDVISNYMSLNEQKKLLERDKNIWYDKLQLWQYEREIYVRSLELDMYKLRRKQQLKKIMMK